MPEETKKFPLRVVLTVTTGYLLTEPNGPSDNGISDLYEILGWMTNDSPFTHQLPRFGQECKPWLYRWFPELRVADGALSKLDAWLAADQTRQKQDAVQMWLEELRTIDPRFKREYDVPKIPRDDHDVIHPYDELVAMRGTDEGVIVVPAEED